MAAALNLHPQQRHIRMLVLRDHIPQPDLRRIKAELLGAHIQKTLHRQSRNRNTHAPVHPNRSFVGGDRAGFKSKGRNLIGTCYGPGRVFWLKGRTPGIGRIATRITQEACLEAEHGAVALEGQFRIDNLMFGLEGGRQMLTPVFDPFNRLAQRFG